MKLIQQLFEEMLPQSSDLIRLALNQRIFDLGIEGVFVEEVDIEFDGDVIVEFVDNEQNEMSVLFQYDPVDGAEAIVIDDEGGDFEDEENGEFEIDMIDIDPLVPTIINLGNGTHSIDLVNNKWMNRSFFDALFSLADHMESMPSDIDERAAFVIKGGKKVKVALVRRKRKKRLTSKQKAGFKKGARKRKAKKGQINRKRAKSLKVRKRLKLKKNTNKKLKVMR